jgi:hypothetical protein
MYFQNEAGEQIPIYNFSINQEQLDERPFTSGALYFLPRDTFTRLHLTPESYANEWASQLDEYVELQRVMMPAAQFQVESVGQDIKLIVTSLPPAVRQMLAAQYQDIL